MINIEFKGLEQKRQQKIVKARVKGLGKQSKIDEKHQNPEQLKSKSEQKQTTPEQQQTKPEQKQAKPEQKETKPEENKEREFMKLVLNLANPADYTKPLPVIQKKKPDIGQDSEEEEEIPPIQKTDFLSTAEYQELKDKYSDYNIGELVLRFPNPDCPNLQNRPVNIREAEIVFNTQLAVTADGGIAQSTLLIQRQGFLASFLQLGEYIETDRQKLKEINQSKYKESLKKSSTLNSAVNRDIVKYQEYWEQYRQVKDTSVDEIIQKESEQIQPTSDAVNTEIDKLLKLIELKNDNLKSYINIQKQYCGGGFLYKKWTEDKSDYDWIQIGQTPNDFLTLIRMTVITKLSRDAQFHCRQFISSDDQYIFVVLKSKLESIKFQAETQRMQKQYELGFADILSLEPCDSALRPLRLKNYLRDPDFIKIAPEFIEQKKEAPKKKLARIDSEAQKLYQIALKWGDQELRAQCVLAQKILDPLIEQMAKDLKISLHSEKVQIADDKPLARDVWETYHIYQLYLIDYLQRIAACKNCPEVQANKGFLFKLVFRKAIGDPNELYQQFNRSWFKDSIILPNLWDRQGLAPMAPYEQYFITKPNEGLWRQYEVSEKGHRSEFMNMEKLKIANAAIGKFLNLKKLIEKGYILSYFALHDPYQLMGLSKASMIKPLIDLELVKDTPKTKGQNSLLDLFASLKDEAEPSDFDSDCLSDECKFHWLAPTQLPIDSIRDYFGEKIALYFRFLQFYSQQLWNVVIMAIICEAVIDNTSGDAKKAFIIIFAVILISWSSYFICHWKRQETMFQIQYGQNVQSEANEIERPAFEGSFIRSIITDKLNEEFYPGWKKQIKLLYSSFITLTLVAMVIASVIGVFILKNYLQENYEDNQFLVSFVPSMINAIVIQIFNAIYFNISNQLNDFENHKYESTYENSLITKTYTFTFINTFNCLAIIAFLNGQFPALKLCKTNTGEDCYKALKNQMVTIFMVNFAKTLPQLITPCLKTFHRGQSKKADENLVSHEFNEIDEFIEKQSELEPYVSNAEVDGLMNDYMELIVQYAFLQLFGLAFPLCYFIAFLTNCTQIHVDKLKLIHFMQRPIPTSASDIGNWIWIMEIISFLSVFCNAGLVVFTSGIVQPESQSASYAIFVIIFLGLKYFQSFVISPIPEKANLILTRHKFAVDRVHRGMRDNSKSYYVGKMRETIEGVNYGEVAKMKKDHLLKEPEVILEQKK